MNLLDFSSDEPSKKIVVPNLWEAPVPALQWSPSTHSCYRRCQKQFFFGSRMANSLSHDPLRRDAWVLSQLQDLPRWRGRLVDYGLEHFVVPALRFGHLPSLSSVIAQTLTVARRQWAFSEQKLYAQPGLVKGKCGDEFCALFEHEYGINVGRADLEQVEAQIALAFRTLYEMTEFLTILYGQQYYYAQHAISFPFEQARIHATLDLLCWRGNRRIIVDWKAVENETSDHTLQMLVYGWAVLQKWPDLTPDNIAIYEVRLLEGRVKQHHLTPERIISTENFIYQSISEINALTAGKSYKEQDIAHYEPARTPNTCATCNYRRICLQRRPSH